jgi:hypothetical protein
VALLAAENNSRFSRDGGVAALFAFGRPYIVYYGFPEQAYKITLALGFVAIVVAVLSDPPSLSRESGNNLHAPRSARLWLVQSFLVEKKATLAANL